MWTNRVTIVSTGGHCASKFSAELLRKGLLRRGKTTDVEKCCKIRSVTGKNAEHGDCGRRWGLQGRAPRKYNFRPREPNFATGTVPADLNVDWGQARVGALAVSGVPGKMARRGAPGLGGCERKNGASHGEELVSASSGGRVRNSKELVLTRSGSGKRHAPGKAALRVPGAGWV